MNVEKLTPEKTEELAALFLKNSAAEEGKSDFSALFEKRKKLGDFPDPVPDEKNENAIFREKYLRRGQMLLLVSVLGVGKSTFVSQGSECWARGLPFAGIRPAGRLKIGIFETEDDADEVADFRNNFRKGFSNEGWSELEIAEAESGENAPIYFPVDGVGTSRFLDYLEYCVSRKPLDLVLINPAYDFIEGDFSKAEDVSEWKTRLLELAVRYKFAVLLVHHTNKVPANTKERDNWLTGSSAAYAGSGSMVLPSSARAVIFIRPLEKQSGLFEINAAKRGKRLDWRDLDGNKTTIRYMAHSSDFIFWREATTEEILAALPKKKPEGGGGLPVGVQRVVDVCNAYGRPFESMSDFRKKLMDSYAVSDTTCDNWLNKAIDAKRCKKVAVKGSQKVFVGLVEQFGEDDEE